MAAGDRKETRTIFDVPSVNIGRSSLIRPSAVSLRGGEVKVEALDKILADQHAGQVRLIKIDVEGFEPDVLRGAQETLQREPIICMEVSADVDKGEVNPLAAHDLIMQTGLYSAYRFRHGKEHVSELLPVAERSILRRQRHDNVVYVPHTIRPSVPDAIFGS